MPNFAMSELLNVSDKPDFASQTKDFGRAFIHAAVENPINGILQIARKTDFFDVPNLHIVDEKKISNSVGSTLGAMAGTAADVYLMSQALGHLGGRGIVGNITRLGITGAVYEGLLTPSKEDSQSFVSDRLANAAVGASTWAAMGAAGAALDRTGKFAVSEVRSLAGNLAYGGISGGLGGIAHAESVAIFKEGKALQTLDNTVKDVASYAFMGSVFGAINWGANKSLNSPTEITLQDGVKAKVWIDSSRRPVKIEHFDIKPGRTESWSALKMADGQWQSVKGAVTLDGKFLARSYGPKISSAEMLTSKSVVFKDTEGTRHQYTNSAKEVDRSNPTWTKVTMDEATGMMTSRYHDGTRIEKYGSAERHFGKDGSLERLAGNYSSASFEYDGKQVKKVALWDSSNEIALQKLGENRWKVSADNASYIFEGQVKVVEPKPVPPELKGKYIKGTYELTAGGVEFVAKSGESAVWNIHTQGRPVRTFLQAHSEAQLGATGRPFMEVTPDGRYFITGGSGKDFKVSIDRVQLKPGQRAEAKPGQAVELTDTVQHIYTESYEVTKLKWYREWDGKPKLGDYRLFPNTRFDLQLKQGNA